MRADFLEHDVPAQRITSVGPYRAGPVPPEPLRIHAAIALGVAMRCCQLLGATPLDAELAGVRAELDRLDPATIEAARGSAGEVALRAAAALAVATGSRSLLVGDRARRLIREALFGLVYSLRPSSRDAVLVQLRAAP